MCPIFAYLCCTLFLGSIFWCMIYVSGYILNICSWWCFIKFHICTECSAFLPDVLGTGVQWLPRLGDQMYCISKKESFYVCIVWNVLILSFRVMIQVLFARLRGKFILIVWFIFRIQFLGWSMQNNAIWCQSVTTLAIVFLSYNKIASLFVMFASFM
jgi:hypothetical protein